MKRTRLQHKYQERQWIPDENPFPDKISHRNWLIFRAHIKGQKTISQIAEAAEVSTNRVGDILQKVDRLYRQIHIVEECPTCRGDGNVERLAKP